MSTPTRLPHDRGSLTYEPHFGLREKPFSLLPAGHFFFRAAPHKAVFESLLTGIRRREGILTLTGEVGTGKTTLCRAVIDALDRKTFAAYIRDPIVSREDFLKALLVDFGVVSVDEIRGGHLRGSSRTELSYPLYEFLVSLQPLDAFAIVMIDEAQNIPQALLEEIRILSDLDNGQKLLQLILIGQPELDTRLAAPELRQLTQRISLRSELSPLAAADVEIYIRHRLTVAGNGNVGFSDRAIKSITAASAGVPRLINLLCDRTLSRAAEMGALFVSADHVNTAMNDLKWPRASLTSIASAGDDDPRARPVLRSEEIPRRPRNLTDLNVGELERRTPPLGQERAPGQLAASSSQSATPRPTRPAVEPRDAGTLNLLVARDVNSPDYAVQPPRRRRALVVGALTLVILGAAGWGWRYTAVGREVANQADPPVSTAATPPPAAVESSVPLAQDVSAPPPIAEPPVSVPPQGRFAVQVATFTTETGAAESVREFLSAGFPAYSTEATLRDGGRAKAVFVGPYADLNAAERGRERAQQVPGYAPGRIVAVGLASQSKTSAVP